MKHETKEQRTLIKCGKRILSLVLSTVLILGLFLFSPISSINVHANFGMAITITFPDLGINSLPVIAPSAEFLQQKTVGSLKLQIASNIKRQKGTSYTADQLKLKLRSPQIVEMVNDNATLDTYITYQENTHAIVEVTVKGNSSSTTTDSSSASSTPSTPHTHNFVWTTVQEVTTEQDGLEELKCECGAVEGRSVIPASQVFVKGLYGQIKNAAENGTVSFDSGKLYTISDYLIKKLQERNDVTTVINFEYQQVKYRMTIPAGKDYTKLLEDQDYFYGYLFFANEIGATVEAL